ncbi:MAG: ankyrin repeat domain-containing protein [Paenibacillaceae bacterium]|nr:ankyrin repeat domain-containing protein [Paenibacillaceae bacterium]
MKIVNIFDAVKEGSWEEFKKLFNDEINQINEFTSFNLLETLLLKNDNTQERLKIIEFLIKNGIDIHHKEKKYQRNALHVLFFNFLRGDVKYLLEVTKILVSAGINVNEVDIYNAIPLKYSLTISKLKTEEMLPVYKYLLNVGSDYKIKDSFEKSCIDYAQELTWRTEFINLTKEI